jgi:hypothetical protein
MLSVTSGQLAQVIRTSQRKANTSSSIKPRFLTTDASGSGASGKKPNDRFTGNRKGAYTYKQAFESTRNAGNLGEQKMGTDGKRLNLEDRRKSSQARFAGSSQEGGQERQSAGGSGEKAGGYSGVRGRGGQGSQGGPRMPAEGNTRARGSVQDVRRAREAIEDKTNKLGSIKRTINLEGDDGMLKPAAGTSSSGSGSGGRGGSSYGGGNRSGGGRGDFKRDGAGGRGDFKRGAPQAAKKVTHMPPPVGSFGLEARAALEKRGRGAEGEEDGPIKTSAGLQLDFGAEAPAPRMNKRVAARLAEIERLQAKEEAEETAEGVKTEVKMLDEDLRRLKSLHELDEQGEERLVQDKPVEEEEDDREAVLAGFRVQVAGAIAIQREIHAEAPLVDMVRPEKKAKPWVRAPAASASDVIKTVSDRIIDTASAKPFTMEELDNADAFEDVLSPDTLETPLELEEEKILMETQFTFGHQRDITLHSEKGLIYGIVDMFDRMVVEKKELLITKARKQKRFQIWRAISWAKREKNIAKRNERKKRLHAEARARWTKNSQDPNMVYYPSLHLWFSKDELRHDVFRNALSAALSNPSWDRSRRRSFMQGMQADLVKLASPLPPSKQIVFDSVYNIPKRPKPTDSRTIEHLHTLPITDWSLMMAQAERAMDPADRLKRFDPSPYEKKNNVKL